MSNLHKKALRQKAINQSKQNIKQFTATFKVHIGKEMVSLVNFKTVDDNYSMGTVLDVVDIFSENGCFFIAIKTKSGVQEIGFKYPNPINSKEDLLAAAINFIVPYVENATYYSI